MILSDSEYKTIGMTMPTPSRRELRVEDLNLLADALRAQAQPDAICGALEKLTGAVIGHRLGCSGAIEAVATVLCLQRGELHPVRRDGEADPELPVSLVLDVPLSLPEARAAVSTSLAFGGSNAALVFSPWRDQAA